MAFGVISGERVGVESEYVFFLNVEAYEFHIPIEVLLYGVDSIYSRLLLQ